MQYEILETERRAFNSQERTYHDTTTWLAEVLDGNMRTEFEYTFDGRELYASDGSPLGAIFTKAIEDAGKLTEENPNLAFEKCRREEEIGEYRDMLKMASGEHPNTMVVISEFPDELAESEDDIGGYNTNRKQTMLRVINRQENGRIKIISQSLDKSDRAGLESIYHFFGLQPSAESYLGQRIYADIEPQRQELLADELTREYDRALEQKFGGQYYGGRAPVDKDNTYDFVLGQKDLIDFYMTEPSDNNMYALAAAVEHRYTNRKNYKNNEGQYHDLRFSQLYDEIQIAYQRATQQGKVYSGCGISLSGAAGSGPDKELENLGYGNKLKQENYRFDKKMHCVVCQPEAKDNEPKKMCGPCGICRDCDRKLT